MASKKPWYYDIQLMIEKAWADYKNRPGKTPKTTEELLRTDVGAIPKRGPLSAHLLTFAVWALPGIPITLIGFFLGLLIDQSLATAVGFAFLWTCVLGRRTAHIYPQQQWRVVERAGKYWCVLFAGISFVMPGIDKIRAQGDIMSRKLMLYNETHPDGIDFTDGTAPVRAFAQIQIGNPLDIRAGNWKEVEAQIALSVYATPDSLERVRSAIESVLRPRLQEKSVDEASIESEELVAGVPAKVADTLASVGFYLTLHQSVVIDDIDQPPAMVVLRQEKLAGEKAAQKRLAEAKGMTDTIRLIMTELKLTEQEAVAFYNQRELNSLMPGLGANYHFFGNGFSDIKANLTINPGEERKAA